MSTRTLSAAARERTLSCEPARFWANRIAPAHPAPRDVSLRNSTAMNVLRPNGGANSFDPGFLRHQIAPE